MPYLRLFEHQAYCLLARVAYFWHEHTLDCIISPRKHGIGPPGSRKRVMINIPRNSDTSSFDSDNGSRKSKF